MIQKKSQNAHFDKNIYDFTVVYQILQAYETA